MRKFLFASTGYYTSFIVQAQDQATAIERADVIAKQHKLTVSTTAPRLVSDEETAPAQFLDGYFNLSEAQQPQKVAWLNRMD